MPASVMTMPEARKAIDLYQQGLSQPAVAQAIKRSRKAVRTAFRQLGVQMRDASQAQLIRYRKEVV